MGTIKTTNIEPIADNGTVTLGSSGDTFTLGSGVKQSNMLYPAFHVFLSATTSVSDNTYTKIPFNTETIDTNNAYDNSTNYRFTVPSGQAGKYFIYVSSQSYAGATSNLQDAYAVIYKNGVIVHEARNDFRTNYPTQSNVKNFSILDLAEGDYVEGYGVTHSVNGSNPKIQGSSSDSPTFFGGYRIGS